jgi:hypothetical protein
MTKNQMLEMLAPFPGDAEIIQACENPDYLFGFNPRVTTMQAICVGMSETGSNDLLYKTGIGKLCIVFTDP